MRKYKPEITIKKLSWEYKSIFHKCDMKNCNLEGKYKAPKSVFEYPIKSWFSLRSKPTSEVDLKIIYNIYN